MNSKTHLILAQVFISGMMAFCMTGFFAGLHLGLSTLWLVEWARSFVLAWPVAFAFSMVIGPLGFKAAGALLARQRAG